MSEPTLGIMGAVSDRRAVRFAPPNAADAGGWRRSIRSRARAARLRSAEQRERSRLLAEAATMVGGRSEWLCGSHRRLAARRLEWETAAVDEGVMTWPSLGRFVELDAGVVGRDSAIEEAKTLLCQQLGISRRDAFAILQRVSTNSNRKLRAVARALIDESHESPN